LLEKKKTSTDISGKNTDDFGSIHAETSIVRTEKTPIEPSQVAIQSSETSVDIRQNIHAETSMSLKK
jgi:hypothetical protein